MNPAVQKSAKVPHDIQEEKSLLTILADVVPSVTNNQNLRRVSYRSNKSKRLIAIGIAKSNNCSSSVKVHSFRRPAFWKEQHTSINPRRTRRAQPLRSSMNQLRTLTIPTHNNLRRRAARRHRVDQVEHRRRTRSVPTGQEARDISWVVDALDSNAARAPETASQRVEEDWALAACLADVAGAVCATRPDEADGAAG